MIFGKTRSDLKYLLDSLIYLAGRQVPYIHVILSYVKNTTAHYQSAVSMMSFAQVLTAQ